VKTSGGVDRIGLEEREQRIGFGPEPPAMARILPQGRDGGGEEAVMDEILAWPQVWRGRARTGITSV